MNITMISMTTQIPSGAAMPTCATSGYAIAGRIATSGALTGAVVRDRQGVATFAHATKTFPWTHAWRPPIS